jgi:hypothetical protein
LISERSNFLYSGNFILIKSPPFAENIKIPQR